MREQRVCVIGAGIGGLTTAIYLSLLGKKVQLFEQAAEFKPVGAGVLIPPAGQKVLRDLDIYDRVSASSARIEAVRAELKGGESLLNLPYGELSAGRHALGTSRPVLFAALLEKALKQGVQIECGKKLLCVFPLEDSVRIHFADGTRRPSDDFDFIVITDGSKSQVGYALNLRRISHRYSHEAMWLTGSIGERDQRYLLQRMDGVRRLTGLLPLGGGKAGFFWGVREGEVVPSLQQLKDEAMEIIPEAEQLLNGISSLSEFTRTGYRFSLHWPWHSKRVILLGDAAHSMSPHLGQGASLAMLDAMSLGKSVRENPENLNRAFKAYQKNRFRRVLYVSGLSAIASPFFQSDWDSLIPIRNRMLPLLAKNRWVRSQMIASMSGTKTDLFRTEDPSLI